MASEFAAYEPVRLFLMLIIFSLKTDLKHAGFNVLRLLAKLRRAMRNVII